MRIKNQNFVSCRRKLLTFPPAGAYSNLSEPRMFKDTKMAFGRRGYSLRTRSDTVQEGLGAMERHREKGIRTDQRLTSSKKKKKSPKKKLKPKTLKSAFKLK